MSRRLIVRPEAEADISDAAVWYDRRENGGQSKVRNPLHVFA